MVRILGTGTYLQGIIRNERRKQVAMDEKERKCP